MAWIEVVDEEDWDGELAELRPRLVDRVENKVDGIMAIQSLNPEAMAANDALYRSAMRGTASLPKVDRNALRVLAANEP